MEIPKPSAYSPFFRRFANERELELGEVEALYGQVRPQQDAFSEDLTTIGRRVYEYYSDQPADLVTAISHAMYELLRAEPYLGELPPPAFEKMSLAEFVEYRNLLLGKQYFFANQEELLEELHEGLVATLCGPLRHLPETATPTPFTIPLVYALPNPRADVDLVFRLFTQEAYNAHGLFNRVAYALYRNICAASGRDPDDEKSKKPLKFAGKSTLPLGEMVDAYLGDTPYHQVFTAPVPLKLTRDDRMNHMHVVGGTGAGKTTLIENLILHDLKSEDPPSLVVIDPHGDLIKNLTRANLGIGDRLILIDPRDTQHPPALNIFAVNQERMASYDEATKEQVTAGVIQTFDYLFSGLIGADLTAKQGVFFRYVARLMLSLPEHLGRNATILDMLRLMSDATPYMPAINALPEIPRDFFLRDFPSKTFAQTKEQIRYRLQAILENPTMARLFTSTETKVDIFGELNRGSVILVDTAKDFLKSASPNFGRIFISLVLQAVLERAAVSPKERKDTFLIVDEAASYFDSNIDDLLTDSRKYRCGLVLAHQYLDQATGSLRASLAANTGAKFVSGVSSGDARALAPDLRTSPDFILEQPKLQFAAHIRGVTPHAVSIPVTPGILDREPRFSEAEREALMARNRERVSLPSPEATLPPTALPEPRRVSTDTPDEEVSREW